MQYEPLTDNLRQIISLTDSEIEELSPYIHAASLDRNQFFLKEGEICQSIAFVSTGCIVYLKTNVKGDNITTDFAFEGDWVTNNLSRIRHERSMLSIKAIEPTELLIISNSDLLALYDKIPRLERIGRILMEEAYLKLVQTTVDMQLLSAKTRYLRLVEQYPKVMQRVPLYHIANYLGIAPKSLSRIRSEIAQS
jgi:CRP/FNR family transcriptional regulator, anaerobic regulatory protein